MSDEDALRPVDEAGDGSEDGDSRFKRLRARVGAGATSRGAVMAYVAALCLAAFVGVTYLSLQLAGIIDTIAYVFVFFFGLTMIPFTILFGSPSFPGFLRKFFGKLHFILGQVAFGAGYLVQHDGEWRMCPGDKESVYIEGEWREIDGGQENLQILGWMPFGIIFDKTEDAMEEERIDLPGAKPQADGGQLRRQGHLQADPDKKALDDEDTWVVDLKRVFWSGVDKMGDIELIEKAEEVVKRQENKESAVGGYEPIIATAIGLIIGGGFAWMFLGGV